MNATPVNIEKLTELLQDAWKGSQRMVDHCLKNDKYVEINGVFINCGDMKPSIDSDMWYNDETTAPGENFENFRRYNMRNNARPMLSETTEFGGVREIWLAQNYHSQTNNELLTPIVRRVDDLPRACELRRATAEEVAAINNARAEVNADYEKRLERYWARYSKKVSARGYWANR